MSEEIPPALPPFAPQWARRIAALCAALCGIVLLAWLTGREDWLGFGEPLFRIAPGTATLLFPLAVAIWLRAGQRNGTEGWGATALAFTTLALALVIVFARILDLPIAVEAWLAGADELRDGPNFGRVSPHTAALIALFAASVAVRRFVPRPRPIEAALAFTVVAVSAVVLQGYLLGGPLLGERMALPIAAITALLLLLLGIAQLFVAGAQEWPLRILVSGWLVDAAPPTQTSFRNFAFVVSGFVLASGFFWYLAERDEAQAQALADHATAADLKAGELSQWLRGHLSTANSLRALALVWGDLDALAAVPRSRAAPPVVERWLTAVRAGSDYEFVALFAPDGAPLAVSPDSLRRVPAPWGARVRALGRSDRVIMDEQELGSERRLTFWVPLYDPERRAPRLWLALAVDTRRSLLPILSALPALGRSSELILWRVVGDTAESINDVPFRTAVAGVVRLALDEAPSLPIARSIRGEAGVLEGPDLRGVPVVAYVRPVDGTAWRLVLKIDREELRAPVRRLALGATLSTLLLVLVIAAAIFALWSRRDLAAATRELRLVRDREEGLVRLTQLDRMLRLRGATDLALIRAHSEAELLQAVCDAAVETGGYRMAWVGMVEHDPAKRVRPVAISGDDRGYLARFPVSWSPDDLPGQGPTGRSIRSGSVQATRDIYADLSGEWAAAARARGYVGACSIPLKVRGEVVGVLMMYAGEALELHEEEVSLLGDVGDDLSYGIAAIRDRAAMTAQQSELKLFREVMERSTDAIYLLDADTARIIDFNETALRSLGYTAEELRALGPKDIASDVPDDAAWRRRSDDVLSGAVSTRRTTHRRKDGTTYPVDVSLTAIKTAGRRLMLSVARDITDRVRAEEESERLQAQFLRAQRMESVGRLAGGVAHDFNNLLTVINGTADLALADLPPDSAVRSDLQEIRAAGDRAAALTRQLLAFSRQQVLHPEHLDLNEVVPAFLGMLKRVIGEDIDVEVRLASVAAHVLADHGQLEQVLMNLCVNARDAMPNGGRLTIGVDLVNVDAATAAEIPTMRPGPAVRLAISDTGEGMSPELQLRIFEPFFTTKEAGRGTGLGLSTVYGIVKQSGGHLGVTSQRGKGTTFTIYLPVALPPAVPGPAVPKPKQATGTETILVVEDEEAIRFVVRRVLERSGYKVLEAATGADALAEIAAHDGPLDLVMTDLVMPGMSGIDLARTLRREHPSLRILLASGYSQETVSNEFDKAREWHLISKPYAVNDLLAELRRILDGAEPSSLGGRPPA